MEFALVIGALIITVLLCEKFKSRLPSPIKEIYALWEKFAHVFGLVMNTIILTVFWIVAIGIYAIIGKLIRLTRKKPSDTYWIPAEPRTVDSMHRQF